MSKANKSVVEQEEKITAKIKLDEGGRCESVNGVYSDDDTVIERTFDSEAEAFAFFQHAQDYVYKKGKWVEDPLPEPDSEASPLEILLEENKLLKAQVKSLEETQEFLSDCLIEMSSVVYAE